MTMTMFLELINYLYLFFVIVLLHLYYHNHDNGYCGYMYVCMVPPNSKWPPIHFAKLDPFESLPNLDFERF